MSIGIASPSCSGKTLASSLEFEEAVRDSYVSAARWASLETGLPRSEFPRECPYSWDHILNRPFELDRDR